MSLRPYKFMVQAIVQEVNDNGDVIDETQAEPVILFGCASLEKWAQEFPENLKNALRE